VVLIRNGSNMGLVFSGANTESNQIIAK